MAVVSAGSLPLLALSSRGAHEQPSTHVSRAMARERLYDVEKIERKAQQRNMLKVASQ